VEGEGGVAGIAVVIGAVAGGGVKGRRDRAGEVVLDQKEMERKTRKRKEEAL
jgi:hypothetical protein